MTWMLFLSYADDLLGFASIFYVNLSTHTNIILAYSIKRHAEKKKIHTLVARNEHGLEIDEAWFSTNSHANVSVLLAVLFPFPVRNSE